MKEWFRGELDKAGEAMSEEMRVAVIQEAKDAFKYNIGVSGSSICSMLSRAKGD